MSTPRIIYLLDFNSKWKRDKRLLQRDESGIDVQEIRPISALQKPHPEERHPRRVENKQNQEVLNRQLQTTTPARNPKQKNIPGKSIPI